MNIAELKIRDMRKMLDGKEISAAELAEEYLKRIADTDGKLESYITVTPEEAKSAAEKAQAVIDSGKASPLTGVPLAIKDNICTDGVKTTCASKMLEDFVPPYNATVMEKLNAEGIVMLGKTSMDEFAMGGSTQTSAFKKTKNPYDLGRVPGGSSGGSAAAVGASLCAAALGSDTGGSIRQPASFCGVTGLKPTYGRVSRYGLVAFASSLDQIGPIAKDAHDCAIILNAISGYDYHDGTSAKLDVPDFTAKIGQSVKGMKIAMPKEFYADGIDPEVRTAVENAAKQYQQLGAEILECSMPSLKYAVAAYYLIASAEASSNLSRYDGIKYGHRSEVGDSYSDLVCNSRSEGFGDEVKRRILLGNYALSSGYYDAYYGKAMALKQKIREEYESIFEGCDVILTPTAPTVAYGVNENISDPAKMYQADICTVTVNIASLPAISTPCGYDKNGMPIGMSIVGKRWDEATVIQAADAYEKQFAYKAANI
ncbi:MAG: Asp-tRNA(Asn)/Glu-tRNA(Gln) amidotransferase subunit GatA [Ruminococcus sp.]|nr:Asp-tRNA(Asn)/Glu-tRNA(Gln) amidotransferase subunit GatA [Ruminococcus sp.]MCM1380622.1 Asp-tRNA(Asn)/Glu-tRNA(Gln) amidotransferase subunit GatA [Muribaculaceae bacterium]MCM1478364.1 Asp-tRNA(Asn)/Glu-tRNA(Gln) amidotransferase subunit GatA [Muribaculaceae bacterium]